MEYKNEQHKASFTLPDTVTVRQQLAYYSEAALASGEDLFERLWRGARAIIRDWQCPALPDIGTDLDNATSTDATAVIIWAALRVKEHMDRLENIPKN